MASAPDRVQALLKKSDPFGALPDEALGQLIRCGRLARYGKDDVIYTCGDAGDSLMVLLSGSVKITNVSANGREIVLSFLKEGALMGEIAVLDGKERTANAIALEDTEALIISRRDLMPVLTAHPTAMWRLLAVICERLRSINVALEGHALQMAARTASALLRLAAQHGQQTEDGLRVDLKITQRDLGNYIGLSRAKVNGILGEFRAAGLVEIERTHVLILDKDNLQAVADSMET